ncbi:phosphate ABC transporter permease subunit PstC [Aquiluna sp. KACHI24]|uniref:phosphate ABC transporter permease subunit PstC n=1 Tax=Aquiluna sp. KACHI24 TaxID=2968831 RepID=UPI00220301DE|nr:phosphate ABC transporter permease subunit PstC [Aquiluna sp. KACHI24]BDQ00088.1 phosphate transport system permease protein [Aquiluna sp. KACHI24]
MSVPTQRKLLAKPSRTADKVFFAVAKAAGYSSFVIIGLILFFLSIRAWPAFEKQGFLEFAFGTGWDNTTNPPILHIGPMLWGSLLIAAIGVAIAVPMAISIAYFIEFLAPTPIAKAATVIVDLLAAIPSVVIGLWGLGVFSPVGAHWAQMLSETFAPILPFLANDTGTFLRSPFIASIVVAVMIVPLISSITREIFSQVDKEIIKGALALGGSRESVLRQVILPTSAGGILGGVLLALGRAMGETVAIFFVLNLVFDEYNWFNLLEPQGGAIASLILARFGEATPDEVEALLAAGVVLFLITLVINAIASYIVQKAQPWRRD